MEEKYCSQLGNIKDKEKRTTTEENREFYKCKITGERCIGAKFENPDPGNPLSMTIEASYNDRKAINCPAYDVPDDLAMEIRKSVLDRHAGTSEKQNGP